MRKHYTFKELDLYHRDVFIPGELFSALISLTTPRYLRLAYSTTARRRAEQDNVPVQDYVTLRPDNIIEIGCLPGEPDLFGIDTVVVREPFSYDKDILLSIAVDFQLGVGTVKMAWTHTPGKPHFSLKDRRDYIAAPKPVFNNAFDKLKAAV
jgi:hypothetical protein